MEAMAQLLSDYIFKKSLSPFGHKLCVRNETSHTQFVKSEAISIKELKEDGLTLELPINVCQKGHNLTLYFLDLDYKNKITLPISGHFKEALFEAMGKVERLEMNKINKDFVFIDLHFTQYDQIGWKKILMEYSKNQDEINDVLKSQHRRDTE